MNINVNKFVKGYMIVILIMVNVIFLQMVIVVKIMGKNVQ